jgi:hypothetical protein
MIKYTEILYGRKTSSLIFLKPRSKEGNHVSTAVGNLWSSLSLCPMGTYPMPFVFARYILDFWIFKGV